MPATSWAMAARRARAAETTPCRLLWVSPYATTARISAGSVSSLTAATACGTVGRRSRRSAAHWFEDTDGGAGGMDYLGDRGGAFATGDFFGGLKDGVAGGGQGFDGDVAGVRAPAEQCLEAGAGGAGMVGILGQLAAHRVVRAWAMRVSAIWISVLVSSWSARSCASRMAAVFGVEAIRAPLLHEEWFGLGSSARGARTGTAGRTTPPGVGVTRSRR